MSYSESTEYLRILSKVGGKAPRPKSHLTAARNCGSGSRLDVINNQANNVNVGIYRRIGLVIVCIPYSRGKPQSKNFHDPSVSIHERESTASDNSQTRQQNKARPKFAIYKIDLLSFISPMLLIKTIEKIAVKYMLQPSHIIELSFLTC